MLKMVIISVEDFIIIIKAIIIIIIKYYYLQEFIFLVLQLQSSDQDDQIKNKYICQFLYLAPNNLCI